MGHGVDVGPLHLEHRLAIFHVKLDPVRLLAVVIRDLIQQALHQVLDGIFDPDFSEHSYGFRRGRSARDAVKAARRLVVEEGRRWVVDIDIKAFFDHIDHDILMRMVALKAKDRRVLKLIGKYLRCGVLENGKVKRAAKGTPQGGPLSPLLGNIYLDALDREFERRGVAFCRYADDVTIQAKSPRSWKKRSPGSTRSHRNRLACFLCSSPPWTPPPHRA